MLLLYLLFNEMLVNSKEKYSLYVSPHISEVHLSTAKF